MSTSPYPALADYGVVANGTTAALVSRTGSIDWLCLPRLDSASTFGRLLDWHRGGYCHIAPAAASQTERAYVDASLVLETTFVCPGGEVVLRDAILHRSEGDDCVPVLVRVIEGVSGTVEMSVRVVPRFDYGQVRPWLRRDGAQVVVAIGGDDALVISSSFALDLDADHGLAASPSVTAGQRQHLALEFRRPETIDPGPTKPLSGLDIERGMGDTLAFWERWNAQSDERDPTVRRSAAVLKGLVYPRTGAMAAAATTSLPEAIGAERNWDYRFSWIRDSVFAARSLAVVGFVDEADAYRRFVTRSSAGHGEELQIAYGLDGERRLGEQLLPGLEGYRASAPVHVGNGAVEQLQLDTIGELVNLAWRWHERGHAPDDDHWHFLASVVDIAAQRWDQPDAGLWEGRGDPAHFVHSKAMCWVAVDRGIKLAQQLDRPAPLERWAQARTVIRAAVDRDGFDPARNTYVQAFGSSQLDAAALLLPIAGYVPFDDERMLGTVDAVRTELDAGGGLLYRYRRDDDLGGQEGAFLPCTFWLAECLARQGRLRDAREAFDAACATSNDLGLFSEEFDPARQEMLGNLPQALTHLSHIGAAIALRDAGA